MVTFSPPADRLETTVALACISSQALLASGLCVREGMASRLVKDEELAVDNLLYLCGQIAPARGVAS